MFFEALCSHLDVIDVQIQDFGGTTEFRPFLKALLRVPGFRSTVSALGIVRDAEANAAGAGASVRDALRLAGLPAPAQPLERVSLAGQPRISYMILPDGVSAGNLETVCLRSVAGDPALECVDRYFECLASTTVATPRNAAKARVQAFLASRAEPGKLLGQAAHAGYWPWASPALQPQIDFIRLI